MHEYVIKKVSDLVPYINNSRTHSEEQTIQIASSISEFGFTNPVLIDDTNNLIAGHGRLLAAKKLGLEEVPAIVLTGLSKAQKKAYVIADNQLALNSGWDLDMLKIEIEGLKELDFDIGLLGFEDDFLDGLLEEEPAEGLTDEDEVPEPPETPISVLGDIWQLGNHRLMCGDSTSIDAVDKLMDGLKPNVVFTDPPYGISIVSANGSVGGGTIGKYREVLGDGDTTVAVDAFNLCKTMNIPEIFFWGANHYSSVLPNSSCWVVWDKQGGKSVTFADCELCYTNLKKPVRMFTHIWDGFRRDSEKGEKRVHPTQKPVKLFVDIWNKFNTGQVVLDLFLGSGSTLIACETSERVCYGMELDEKYVDVIISRWQSYTGKEAIHIESGKTYKELKDDQPSQ
jgi:16S rRNA G966 N2-methylase RsmD